MKRFTARFASALKRAKTHFAVLGFTNRLALYILALLVIGLAGGFYLANKCIASGFTGSLACWTIIFTPIGTACSMVLGKVVDKNRDENTSADGNGIKYAQAEAQGFVQADPYNGGSANSPGI